MLLHALCTGAHFLPTLSFWVCMLTMAIDRSLLSALDKREFWAEVLLGMHVPVCRQYILA